MKKTIRPATMLEIESKKLYKSCRYQYSCTTDKYLETVNKHGKKIEDATKAINDIIDTYLVEEDEDKSIVSKLHWICGIYDIDGSGKELSSVIKKAVEEDVKKLVIYTITARAERDNEMGVTKYNSKARGGR